MKVKINNKTINLEYCYHKVDLIGFCSKTQMLTLFNKEKKAIVQLHLSPLDFLIDVEIEND